ncbi:sialidase-3-like [Sardina pilchardus]|uniref:sialidase-3-like n=1 Tax=Sardina pilchardus TaxID=27697 RepID=UPI002E11C640
MGYSHDSEEIIFGDKTNYFRIPALLYIGEWNKFLAFAEKRTGGNNDEYAENLVMRTGTRDSDKKVKWSPVEDLRQASKHGYRTMNPCPVFETATGKLFLFFICIKGKKKEGHLKAGETRLCFVTTTDVSKPWNDLKDVTDDIEVDGKKLSEYQTFAVGPGHGLEVKTSGHGTRLLIPAYVKSGKGSHSLVFYSDNGGESWQAGEHLSEETGECQVAEIQGSELYCNARTLRSEKYRIERLSSDTGARFTKLLERSLPETPHGCEGSVLGFPAPDSSNTWLLFSHPQSGSKNPICWKRFDLSIYLRESLKGSWGKPVIIHPGNSGYSDLTQCEEEHHFACLMECGETKRPRIVFKEFTLRPPYYWP